MENQKTVLSEIGSGNQVHAADTALDLIALLYEALQEAKQIKDSLGEIDSQSIQCQAKKLQKHIYANFERYLTDLPVPIIALRRKREELQELLGDCPPTSSDFYLPQLQVLLQSLHSAWVSLVEEIESTAGVLQNSVEATEVANAGKSATELIKLVAGATKELRAFANLLAKTSIHSEIINSVKPEIVLLQKRIVAGTITQALQKLKAQEGEGESVQSDVLAASYEVAASVEPETLLEEGGKEIFKAVADACDALSSIPLVGPALTVVAGIARVYVTLLKKDIEAVLISKRVLWASNVLTQISQKDKNNSFSAEKKASEVQELAQILKEIEQKLQEWTAKGRGKKFASALFGRGNVFKDLDAKLTAKLGELTTQFVLQNSNSFDEQLQQIQEEQERHYKQFEHLAAQVEHGHRELKDGQDKILMYVRAAANSKQDQEKHNVAKEILDALEQSQEQRLIQAKRHIKAGNLEEAQSLLQCYIEQKHLPAEDMAKSKILLMVTLFKQGIKSLQARKYEGAATKFGEAMSEQLQVNLVTQVCIKKLKLFQACALYEAGKQCRANDNWGKARKCFEAAQETDALPSALQTKASEYRNECKKQCKGLRQQAKLEQATEKIVSDMDKETQAVSLYKKAKRALDNGNFGLARDLFDDARDKEDLPQALYDRAFWYCDRIDDLEVAASRTANVFSDNCTHVLRTSKVTLGISTAEFGLPFSKSLSIDKHPSSRDMVIVLNKLFPAESEKRSALIVLLKTDVDTALATVSTAAKIHITDLSHGSIIIYFRFVIDDSTQAAFLEEEYLRQVDDKKSALYQGKVTCHIDQKRTQTMTLQLRSNCPAATPCPYQPGDTITLAQVQEETITCQVESLVGEGATATVFKVVSNGKVCALKVFKAENSLEDLCTEASLMLTASHPHSHANVLRADFVWYEQRTHEMFFLLDFVDGEDLQAWTDDERLYAGTAEEQQERLVTIIHELVCGLQHLHWLGILHEDFKPRTCL
eukprot:g2446.t1